jgi:hypothetical protein
MKKMFLASVALVALACSLTLFQMSSCTKTLAETKIDTILKCPTSIVGLWEGTYTVPDGTSFYFSFSVYPNGTMSYKGKGRYNGSDNYIVFADGTWKLDGANFTFAVTTINDPYSAAQSNQIGSATYNADDETLKNGVIGTDIHGNSVWSMKKVH